MPRFSNASLISEAVSCRALQDVTRQKKRGKGAGWRNKRGEGDCEERKGQRVEGTSVSPFHCCPHRTDERRALLAREAEGELEERGEQEKETQVYPPQVLLLMQPQCSKHVNRLRKGVEGWLLMSMRDGGEWLRQTRR
eukprot:755326-Hanusia_phi.AAC.5